MLAIAGGIILAVLFFMFLPLVLELSIFIIGIGLIIGVGIGVYLLFKNYFVDNIPIPTHTSIPVTETDFTYVIIVIVVVAICVLISEIADNTNIFRGKSDNEVRRSFYIPILTDTFNTRRYSIEQFLLKKDGINSVIFNKVEKDYGEFEENYGELIVSFNTNKINYEDIEIIINKLHLK
jgi:hypothetical protein